MGAGLSFFPARPRSGEENAAGWEARVPSLWGPNGQHRRPPGLVGRSAIALLFRCSYHQLASSTSRRLEHGSLVQHLIARL